jgi:prepilin-type N-terminal cleavage/methylation domain-containing protein
MKKSSGFTLIEIIIALAVLMVVTTAMMAMSYHTTVLSVQTARLSAAHATAQLGMEELIGRTLNEGPNSIEAYLGAGTPDTTSDSIKWNVEKDGSLPYSVEISEKRDGVDLPEGLIYVIITVYDDAGIDAGRILHTQGNILNTIPGGVV